MKKSALRDVILQKLRDELALIRGAAKLARDEATNEESRARSKYDTHSQEAAYLAQGQAKLAADIETSLEFYASLAIADFAPTDAIALGAVVELENGRQHSWYFVGPRAGGLEFKHAGRQLLIVTPQSPLGRQLIGRHVGDTVQMPGRAGGAVVPHVIRSVE